MKIDILTLFPEMFSPLYESILGRAIKDKKLEINTINIRDFSIDKHKKCDDVPFGGGAGMVMTPQPIYDAIKSVYTDESKLIFLTPKGKSLKIKAIFLQKKKHLIFLWAL
jgi:tRNA (guanine37-N1)-methyltransferase